MTSSLPPGPPEHLGRRPRGLSKSTSVRARARLRELVEEYGSELAASKRVGISQQTVNKILGKGAAIGVHVARAICRHDGVPLEFLLDGVPRNYSAAVREYPGRWARWTLRAVFELAVVEGDAGRTLDAWAEILDRVEHTLTPIMRAPPPKKL